MLEGENVEMEKRGTTKKALQEANDSLLHMKIVYVAAFDEWKVKLKDPKGFAQGYVEDTWTYYTNELQDAIGTAKMMDKAFDGRDEEEEML